MDAQVLVVYATKYGATAEIADKIGQVLRDEGLRAEVLPVDQVSDLGSSRAVVLGSAVYAGQWRKEAAAFLEDNEQALAERPVWLFSSGPTGGGDPVQLMKDWRFPEALQPIANEVAERAPAIDGLPEAILQALILDGEDEAFHIPVALVGISFRHADVAAAIEAVYLVGFQQVLLLPIGKVIVLQHHSQVHWFFQLGIVGLFKDPLQLPTSLLGDPDNLAGLQIEVITAFPGGILEGHDQFAEVYLEL